MNRLRIGNGAGFWGDAPDAPRRLAETGELDYLTLEYLAELTLSILAHQRAQNPELGYISDFPATVAELLPSLRQNPPLRVVTNAGGLNPHGCARAVARVLAEAGLAHVCIAAVSGDDLLPNLEAHLAAGESFAHFDTGVPLGDRRADVVSANAYLGARGIAEALARQAHIVITGRVADASLTVGPAVHEFGWDWSDHAGIAAATVAGHLIECGAQVTGGMYSGWKPDLDLRDVGYPIAVVSADGEVHITKPVGSGGVVSVETVAEQLVYEIGDPRHYLTPDVDADFSQVTLRQAAADAVEVFGAQGGPAPERYKVSLAYRDGYIVETTIVVAGRDAEAKARAAAEMVLHRARRSGLPLDQTHVECLGTGDVLPGVLPRIAGVPEVVLRLSARAAERAPLERLVREVVPLVTSGPPGVTGYTGPRPRPRPVLAYWPTTIARERAVAVVEARTAGEWCS